MIRLEIAEGDSLPDWQAYVERRNGVVSVTEKEYAPERKPRDPAHLHDYGQHEMPVLAFDLHHTLTPDIGFPLTQPPFEGVADFLARMVSRGCCVHVASASLDVTDSDIAKARKRLIEAYAVESHLPISWISANTEATLRIDDRGVPIPPDPDWVTTLPAIYEARILAGPWLLENGVYVRHNLTPVGDLIEEFPDLSKQPKDQPRGYTTQILDFDLHRTICPAWGSSRTAPYEEGGVALVNQLYDAGYIIQVSCGGWNPALVDDQTRDARLAAITQSLWQAGIRFDRVVSKEDCDLWGDDKVLCPPTDADGNIDWELLGTMILARVGPPVSMPAHSFSGPNQIPTVTPGGGK